MQFNRVEIQNFGTIGNVTLDLQNRGLVLVTGVNKDTPKADSNGAGKSLLLDAFCWCIWGRTIREDKDDDVVNNRVGKNCKVSVYFEESGKQFSVIRYRKHEKSKKPNDVELFLNGVDLSGSSMKTTQAVIEGIMGLTFETFCALMPGAGKNAAQMTDADIKELLENMLQITALAKARVETKRRLDKLAPEIVKLEQEISALDNQVTRDKKRRDDYLAEGSVYAARRQEKIDALDKTKAQAVEALGKAQTLLEAGEAANSEVVRITAERSILDSHSRNYYLQLQDIENKMERLRKTIRTNTAEAKGALKVRDVELDKAMRLGVHCEHCDQPISEDYISTLQGTTKDLVDVLQTRLEDLNKLYRDVDTEETEYKRPVLEAQRNLGTEMDQHNASLRLLNPAVEAAKTASAQLSGLEKAVKAVEDQITALEAETSPYAAWILQTEEQIEQALETHQGKMSTLEAKYKLRERLEFWKKAFSPGGIRSFILDNVTPVLNESAAHYCDLLTDGEMSVEFSTKTKLKNGEIREKFSIEVKQKHGGNSYKSNSTGEKQRANLVTAFALSDLAELHSTKRLDFRFLDEPFESVDESGTDAVIALLQEQQSKYPTVFVVTHQSHFKEVFPMEITMVKEGGMSHLEG